MKRRSFPILGVMFLIFLTLKLAEVGAVAAWSWWAVTSPLWVPFAAFGGFIVLVAAVAGITYLINK